MNLKSVGIGLLTGTVISGVAVLLTAPASGRDIRNGCQSSIQSFRQSAKQLSREGIEIKDQAVETIKFGGDILKTASSELKTSFEQWQEDTAPSIDRIKAEVEGVQKNIEELQQLTKKD
ncbi:YtxH domain-containing protein [Alkalicoccobacillus plakortidis]|uniref:YtxH domain-containing protein n=1 Tax=Alkalicoccobacillus plakortidis TaxID=444060 RepID=A0ABT0XL91_9BACI|nr:YtxH domain-containing protein [Alkalicoccobacillus plakortidis]MCM2676673.1 YtxH domain-containing protein [Alkalicoccobacillus plakortidis]